MAAQLDSGVQGTNTHRAERPVSDVPNTQESLYAAVPICTLTAQHRKVPEPYGHRYLHRYSLFINDD